MDDNAVKILAIPLATELTPEAQAILAAKGVVIIKSDHPEMIRMVLPADDIDVLPANEFMWAALDALSMGCAKEKYSQPDADQLRQRLVKNLAEGVTKKRRKLIGWSTPARQEGLTDERP